MLGASVWFFQVIVEWVLSHRGEVMPAHYIPTVFKKIHDRLAARSDTEHEQAVIRLGVSLVVYGTIEIMAVMGQIDSGYPKLFALLYFVTSLLIIVAILVSPARSPMRRIFGNVLDMSGISYSLYLVGSQGAVLMLLYIWVIVGNGFRYGLGYHGWTTGLAVLGFLIATLPSPDWLIPSGVWLLALMLLIILPAYTATLIKKLRLATAQAEQANRAKSEFLATISHDIRTPLAGVIGMASLLRSSSLSTEQADHLAHLSAAASTLRILIDDVLDMARIEAGKIELRYKPFHLMETLKRLRGVVTPLAHDKGLALSIQLPPNDVRLLGDEQRLTQILLNVASNAIRYTPRGQIDIRVERINESAATASEPQWFRFTVQDTGIGMSPMYLAKLFEPFTQEHRPEHGAEGIGLGGAIIRELVQLMGGEIDVQSAPSQGTTVRVSLPFSTPDPQAATGMLTGLHALVLAKDPNALMQTLSSWGMQVACSASDEALIKAGNSRQLQRADVILADPQALSQGVKGFTELLASLQCQAPLVLLDATARQSWPSRVQAVIDPNATSVLFQSLVEVFHHHSVSTLTTPNITALTRAKPVGRRRRLFFAEDNRTWRKVVVATLEHGGYEVVTAHDGDDAMTILAEDDRFDGLILDLQMPGYSGIEVLQFYRLCGLSQTRVPVIALTATATPEMRARCLQVGFTDFLTKPIEPEELLERVKTVFDRSYNVALVHDDGSDSADEPLLHEPMLAQIQRMGESFLSEMRDEFERDTTQLLRQLRFSVNESEQFRTQAHALKGCAASLGARRLQAEAAAAMTLAEPAQTGHQSPAELKSQRQAATARLQEVVTETLVAVDEYIASHAASSPPTTC